MEGLAVSQRLIDGIIVVKMIVELPEKIDMNIETLNMAIVVPCSAVIESELGDAVYVLCENKAVLVPVTLGLKSGNQVAVQGGLNENDIVIENPEFAGVQEGKGFKSQ